MMELRASQVRSLIELCGYGIAERVQQVFWLGISAPLSEVRKNQLRHFSVTSGAHRHHLFLWAVGRRPMTLVCDEHENPQSEHIGVRLRLTPNITCVTSTSRPFLVRRRPTQGGDLRGSRRRASSALRSAASCCASALVAPTTLRGTRRGSSVMTYSPLSSLQTR